MSSTEVQLKHDHLITIEQQEHRIGEDGRITSYRAACGCGQSGPWLVNRDKARDEGRRHFAAAVPPVEPAALPPCPSWCTVTTVRQHGYDEFTDVDDNGDVTWVRYHVLLDLDVHQREANRNGVVTLGPLFIYTTTNIDGDDLTPHQAREFAARLLASAAKIDELTA
jgi:hypothetical protein